MKTKYKKIINILLIALFAITLFYGETVLADEVQKTSAEINFCDYNGTRTTLKIVGYAIIIMKIAVPLILIFTGIVDFFKITLSGKSDEIMKSLTMCIKRFIAGAVVFLIPGLMDYVFNTLIEYDEPSTKTCTTCLFDVEKCETSQGNMDEELK